MHVVNHLLRERNTDLVLVEGLLEPLVEVEGDRPVVSGVHPDPDLEIHRTGAERSDHDERRGILMHPRIGLDEVLNDLAGEIDVVLVADADVEFDPAGGLGRIVDQRW